MDNFQSLYENLEEETFKRLKISVRDVPGRVFFSGSLLHPTWTDRPGEEVASATLDYSGSDVYLNRTDARPTGRGYGPEILRFALEYMKKNHGSRYAKGYVEFINVDSQSMLRKLGFTRVPNSETKYGEYWEKDL